MVRNISIVVLFALCCAPAVVADDPAPGACADEKSHQFDFWIGEWEVYADGELAGTNSIRAILDGCVLQESWSGSGGSAGTSLNFYDPSEGAWRQLWVWRKGTTLELSGAFADGKMVLEDAGNRITWHDLPDGTVRQVWERSQDDGESWTTVFDGTYRRR